MRKIPSHFVPFSEVSRPMTAKTTLAVLFSVLFAAGDLYAVGKPEVDLEFDAYYSALGLTLPFTKEEVQKAEGKSEFNTYLYLLSQGLVPRFMVLEWSVNPMPLSGWLIRKNFPKFYQGAQFGENSNMIEAVTAGFEEPYALALFLGNVVDFQGGGNTLGRSRKGYTGYLASMGNYHLMNNLMIPDNWLEVEGKIKGDQKTEARKMSFSFRGGRKFHSNREITDTFYLGIRRSRIDYKPAPYSWLLSSSIEYRADFSYRDMQPISHFVLLEKNVPIPKKKFALSLGIGYLWRAKKKYSGLLAERRRAADSQFLLRPNLRF